MLLVAWLLWRRRHRWRPGTLFALYLVLAGIERFLVEFMRRNDRRVPRPDAAAADLGRDDRRRRRLVAAQASDPPQPAERQRACSSGSCCTERWWPPGTMTSLG